MAPFNQHLIDQDHVSWRDYRTLSRKQRIALDFVTNQGIFAGNPRRQPHCLYGGAGWGGKSYLLRSAAFEINMVLRNLGFPDSWGVLFCDTYKNLEDRHISKFEREFEGIASVQSTQVHGLHVKFHGEGMGGLYLRNMETYGASKRGAERRYALFDELTELDYDQFTNGMYTVRPDVAGLPFVACLAATNPDGKGHRWVRDIFHPEYRDMEHVFFKGVSPKDVLFVQAFKADNPAYEDQKEIIDARLAMSEDEDIRRARDEGAWDLYASGRFPMFRESVHVVPDFSEIFRRFGVPEGVSTRDFIRECNAFGFKVFSTLDYGTSADGCSAYLQHLVDPNDNLLSFRRLAMVGLVLEDQAEKINEAEKDVPIAYRLADPMIRGRVAEEKKQTGLTRQAKFAKLGIRFKLAVNDRVEGASTCEWVLAFKKDAEGRIIRPPRARFLKKQADGVYGVPELIKEIPGLPRDASDPEDVDPMGGIFHWYDSWRYGVHTRYRGLKEQAQRAVWGSAGYFKQLAADQDRRLRANDEW